MKIIILLVIFGFVGILLFALGLITGVTIATEMEKKEGICTDDLHRIEGEGQ